jgi:hypothetical protein
MSRTELARRRRRLTRQIRETVAQRRFELTVPPPIEPEPPDDPARI